MIPRRVLSVVGALVFAVLGALALHGPATAQSVEELPLCRLACVPVTTCTTAPSSTVTTAPASTIIRRRSTTTQTTPTSIVVVPVPVPVPGPAVTVDQFVDASTDRAPVAQTERVLASAASAPVAVVETPRFTG